MSTRCALSTVTFLLLCLRADAYPARINQGKPRPPTKPEEIVEYVMPRGEMNVIRERVAQYPRAKLVRLLTAAQRDAIEPRAQSIAYLLAYLHYDYTANRQRLIHAMRGCRDRPVTRGCSEDTALLLINLYERGDRTLLKPLLDAASDSDGALSELLGTFYNEVLEKHPRTFLRALATRPPKEQKQLGWFAGALDGPGMAPSELREVRARLRRFMRKRDRLAPAARRCLAGVESANAGARHHADLRK